MVLKTAGDLGGAVVGEAQQKVLSVLQWLGGADGSKKWHLHLTGLSFMGSPNR